MGYGTFFIIKKQLLDFDTSQLTKYKKIIWITKRVLIDIMSKAT